MGISLTNSFSPTVKPYPEEDNPLLSELSRYLETAGINDPFMKIYITTYVQFLIPSHSFP
jgi:hypothetical protein